MSNKIPKKFIGKALYEVDSHDLCIELIKMHKRKKVEGTIDAMTSEPHGTPLIALHEHGKCHLLNAELNMSVEEFWLDFIGLIEEINRK